MINDTRIILTIKYSADYMASKTNAKSIYTKSPFISINILFLFK